MEELTRLNMVNQYSESDLIGLEIYYQEQYEKLLDSIDWR